MAAHQIHFALLFTDLASLVPCPVLVYLQFTTVLIIELQVACTLYLRVTGEFRAFYLDSLLFPPGSELPCMNNDVVESIVIASDQLS